MTERHTEESDDHPVPRDMPDQQAQEASDPWEAALLEAETAAGRRSADRKPADRKPADRKKNAARRDTGRATDAPDTR